MPNVVDSRVLLLLHRVRQEMNQAMQSDAGHDVDKETIRVSKVATATHEHAYLTTLSMEWKTSEFRHMMMATALLPNARQYVAMKSRLDCGNTQTLKTTRMLTK